MRYRRSFILILVLVLSSCSFDGRTGKKDEIRAAVLAQVREYPASTLQDIYKSFYQDHFGPGHLLEDTNAAWQYFNHELERLHSRGKYLAEPCGTGRHFVRVPMDLVKDSVVDIHDYFHSFLESAAAFSVPDIEKWKKDWTDILRIVEEMDLELPDFQADKIMLEGMLQRGESMVHHSPSYTLAYDPHYRIMTPVAYNKLMELD